VLGLEWAVTVGGSSPVLKLELLGFGGSDAVPQSTPAGVPLPLVLGSWIAPMTLPPNSPVTIASCEPGATAIPFVPSDKSPNSGKFCTCAGAVQVPGAPGTNVACVRSAMYKEDVNSSVASAMPVL